MDEAEFWSLIDRSRAPAGADVYEQALELERLLRGRSVSELEAFDRIYRTLHVRAQRYDVWDAGYLIDGGMSDGGFVYFRDWLISRGREVYELALKDPDCLADVPEAREGGVNGEPLRYAVRDANRETHGQTFKSRGPFDAEPEGESCEDDDFQRRFPRLYGKAFG